MVRVIRTFGGFALTHMMEKRQHCPLVKKYPTDQKFVRSLRSLVRFFLLFCFFLFFYLFSSARIVYVGNTPNALFDRSW